MKKLFGEISLFASILLCFLMMIPSLLFAVQGDSLRIMPLGDSITKGTGSTLEGGYRDDLYIDYTIQGILFNLVGTLNHGVGFDADHEGHGGKRSDWMADSVDTFLDLENPDVVLLHIGTNDISGERDIPDIVADVTTIIDKIQAHNPLMMMFIAGIVPRRDDKDSMTTVLNVEVWNLVEYKKWQGYDIKFVDHNSAFKSYPGWETLLLYDTRHPNDSGYAVMAQVWEDSMALVPPIDTIAPSPVVDLAVEEIGPATVVLSWTAPGDDGIVGIASEYDLRYHTSLITEGNFEEAATANSEPVPSPSGSSEQFIVSGLRPGTEYYFALKTLDDVPNESSISNSPQAMTINDPSVFVDDFNRNLPGPRWASSDSVLVVDNELSYNYNPLTSPWYVRAVFSYARNPEYVMFRYGQGNSEFENGSVGLMMLRNSLSLTNARGYMVRYFNSAYYLYIMNDPMPPQLLQNVSPVPEPEPPQAGDLIKVVYQDVGSENHFEVYKNNILRGTLVDADGILNPSTYYSGIAFENEVPARTPEIDDFTLGGSVGNSAPGVFSLTAPVDGDTLHLDTITFFWNESSDNDPQAVVRYAFYIDADSMFPLGPFAMDVADTLYNLNTDTLQDNITYFWKVVAYDEFGDWTSSQQVFSFLFATVSGIENGLPGASELPKALALSQNYPNPFNPVTDILYEVPIQVSGDRVHVSLRIYSSRGRMVRTLIDNEVEPGRYRISWDGRDDSGSQLASGAYLYMICVGNQRISRKMLLVK